MIIPIYSKPPAVVALWDTLTDIHAALIPRDDTPRVVDVLIMNPAAFYGAYRLSTQIGEQSAQWYAQNYVASGNKAYVLGGWAASAWTPNTAPYTFATLAIVGIAAGPAATMRPWLGTIARHGPHHGLGKHFEVIIREGGGKNYKLIIPGKEKFIWWGKN